MLIRCIGARLVTTTLRTRQQRLFTVASRHQHSASVAVGAEPTLASDSSSSHLSESVANKSKRTSIPVTNGTASSLAALPGDKWTVDQHAAVSRRSNSLNGVGPAEEQRKPLLLDFRSASNDLTVLVSKVSEHLLRGDVVAVPTDTVYGVAALAQNNHAVESLYTIKKRDPNKPIAICVSDVAEVYRWARVSVPSSLLSDLLPGPVTLVFERLPSLNPSLNPHTTLVGVRVPDHPFIRQVSRLCGQPLSLTSANHSATQSSLLIDELCGQPLALTSANRSATQSSLSIDEFVDLWPQLKVIVDGGHLGETSESRLGSTVVDLSVEGQFTVIRPGCDLNRTLGVLVDKYQLTPHQEHLTEQQETSSVGSSTSS